MVVDDKARLALEKQLVKAKKEEADLQKKINQMVADGADQRKKGFQTAVKELDAQKELTQQAKNRLKDHSTFASMQKNFNKSLSQATKQTKTLVDADAELESIKLLGIESDFSEKEILEEILNHRNKMIALSSEQEMLDYDHESTMDAINEMIGDRDGMSEDALKILMAEIELNEGIANSLNEQSAATQLSHDAQEGLLGALGMSKSAMKGLVAGAKQFLAAIMANPILAIGAVILLAVTAMIKLAKAAGELRDELGVSHMQAAGLMSRLGPAHLALKLMGEDSKEVGGALLNAFGTLGLLTNETLIKAGNIRREFGGTHENIASLAKVLHDQVGGTLNENLDLISGFGTQFEAAGIAAGAAISDMAQNSEFLSDYLDGSVQSMVDATISARKLGLELGTVSKIADSLLDFETSISNTMQASLLIGKQLNFDRARGLALEGKTNQAVQDIVGQLGGVAEFQALNVVQKRKLAKSLGVGTDELAALIRGEPIELDQGNELVNSNKNLIEALNNNTIQQGGADLVKKTNNANKQTESLNMMNNYLYKIAKDGKITAKSLQTVVN